MTAAGRDPGEGHGRRADLAAFAGSQRPEWEREGTGTDEDTIVSAAAVGLVELVWRNSPLEDMHGGGGLQLDVAVNILLSRLPGLALAVDERDLTWSASHTIRRLCALPVTWHRESSPRSASLRLTRPALRPRLPEHSHANGSR